MSIGLDTAVILRLLVDEPAAQAAAARRLLTAAGGPVAVSDLAVAETYCALRHHYAVPPDEAVRLLRDLTSDPGVRPTGVAARVLEQVGDGVGGAGLFDRLLHADYADAGLDFVTFDRAASRLPGARLLTA
ncbi:hypothetical protein tb265_14640 [Gemmatimonadetes bacterium T265]|nr:hypothetical protein tb265_14640 [Gemmatimonadetes bacterium T265]